MALRQRRSAIYRSASVDHINRELASPPHTTRAASNSALGVDAMDVDQVGGGANTSISEGFERVSGGMPVAVSLHSDWGEAFLKQARQQWMMVHPSSIDISEAQHDCAVDVDEDMDTSSPDTMVGPHRVNACKQMRVTVMVYGTRSQLDSAHVCVLERSVVTGRVHRLCNRPTDESLHQSALICTENRDVYACSITGRMHVCGDECRESTSRGKRDDSSYVCRVTGNVNSSRGQQMASSVFFRSGDRCDVDRLGEAQNAFEKVGDRRERRRDRKRMLINSRPLLKDTKRIRRLAEKHPPLSAWTESLLGCDSFARVLSMIDDTASPETIGIYGMVDRYIRVARGMTYLLFCKERMTRERNIQVQTQAGTMECIKGRVLETLSQQGGQLVLSQIAEVGVQYAQSQTFLSSIDWNRDMKRRMTIDYADRVVSLWCLLCTETRTGQCVANAFPFQGFVFGALTILARGLKDPHDRQLDIISVDPGIVLNLPTVSGVVECYSAKQIQVYVENIAFALTRAIHQEGLSFDRIVNYTVDLTRVDTSIFTKSIKATPCTVTPDLLKAAEEARTF